MGKRPETFEDVAPQFVSGTAVLTIHQWQGLEDYPTVVAKVDALIKEAEANGLAQGLGGTIIKWPLSEEDKADSLHNAQANWDHWNNKKEASK